MTSVHDDLVAGLAAGMAQDPSYRSSVAAGWKRDERVERMRALADRDPETFDRTFGARGHLTLGFYESAESAAAADGAA